MLASLVTLYKSLADPRAEARAGTAPAADAGALAGPASPAAVEARPPPAAAASPSTQAVPRGRPDIAGLIADAWLAQDGSTLPVHLSTQEELIRFLGEVMQVAFTNP